MTAKIGANNMKGMFASDHYNNGDPICELEGLELSVRDRYTIQIGKTVHLNVTEPYRYMNHNCSPSVKIEGKIMMAAKDIEPGDEITFDYNTTEDVLACPFECNCCGKKIHGKFYEN